MDSIGLVRGQFFGSPARASLWLGDLHRLHYFLEGVSLMDLAGRDLRMQRHPVAIAEQMNLGAKTASGTA